MVHRAWDDFETWKWVNRDVARDAHPPAVPRRGRKVWNVGQLRTFIGGMLASVPVPPEQAKDGRDDAA
jgi:hypothetical protein